MVWAGEVASPQSKWWARKVARALECMSRGRERQLARQFFFRLRLFSGVGKRALTSSKTELAGM